MNDYLRYRGCWIRYDPPPIGARDFDWAWHHDGFDGAPDAGDNRFGHAPSLAEAKTQIDEMIEAGEMECSD